MNCYYHNEKKADFRCFNCNKMICKECAAYNNGQILCKECAEDKGLLLMKNQYSDNNKVVNYKISRFWVTIFSFIPGAGHMFLGLMKKGLQIMFAFFAILAISSIFNTAEFLASFSVLIWFYSVFDAYHSRRKIVNGETVVDEMAIGLDLNNVNSNYIGIGLIIIGGLLLLNELLTEISYLLSRLGFDYNIFRILRDLLFPVALITGGILLIKKSKQDASI